VDGLTTWVGALLDAERADLEPYLRDPFEGLSDDERHQRHAHPAYEYKTTEGPRKAWRWVDDPPDGDGWELNRTSVDPDAFERFDYTEERYWRRLRPGGACEWSPSPRYVQRAAEIEAFRRILAEYVELRDRCAAAWSEYSGWLEGKPVPEPGATAGQNDPARRDQMLHVIQVLALPLAERLGYRKEWRP